MITAKDMSCQRGHFLLFKPVSFELTPGQSLLISGPNGVGKTTLLESLAGMRSFSSGELSYKGQSLSTYKDYWFDQTIFIGHKTGNKKELTCLENLRSYLQIQGIKTTEEQVESALKLVGLAGYEYQFSGHLSAGQKKRLALSRLLLIKCNVWILDEPFVNLDVSGCTWLMDLLKNHLSNQGSLIITAHDNSEIKDIVNLEITLEMEP